MARPTDEDSAAAAVVDLLGVLAYGELCAFDRLADDARMAPDLAARAAMSAMAATEFGHYRALADRLRELGADPVAAMAPFVAAIETWHTLTEPQTWPEAVVKAYVGDGIAADFYREMAGVVDGDTGRLIGEVLTEEGRAEFAAAEVQAALARQPALAGRLALWARRLLGEAISQSQHVLADRESLLRLVSGAGDLGALSAIMGRIAERHRARMRDLGLDP
ncbi:MAG: ferritin-like fold-containing protein [Jatrophihabitans sp.]|uniref:ferritin-like fold-containing protein n=1 Tax=Jatrophihabitans sp. TaxID=1932789 RepID=UPI003F806A94